MYDDSRIRKGSGKQMDRKKGGAPFSKPRKTRGEHSHPLKKWGPLNGVRWRGWEGYLKGRVRVRCSFQMPPNNYSDRTRWNSHGTTKWTYFVIKMVGFHFKSYPRWGQGGNEAKSGRSYLFNSFEKSRWSSRRLKSYIASNAAYFISS